MKIFALSDLHLSFSTPNKSMEVFGGKWLSYAEKIKENWEKTVQNDDIVLIPGDISWAMRLEKALIDLHFIDRLPGKKILLKGNHDYWWTSKSKVEKALPKSLSILQNDAIHIDHIGIAGARLWDSSEFSFEELVEYVPRENEEKIQKDLTEKLFLRELERLKLSLQALRPDTTLRIVMTHFPPIGPDLAPSKASTLIESFNIDICIFGHLHNVKEKNHFGKRGKTNYILTSADVLNFTPLQIY